MLFTFLVVFFSPLAALFVAWQMFSGWMRRQAGDARVSQLEAQQRGQAPAAPQPAPEQPPAANVLFQWAGVWGENAPPWLSALAAYSGFFCAALYPPFLWSELKRLAGSGAIAWNLWSDNNDFSGPLSYLLASLMMALVFLRAKAFLTGERAVRNADGAVMVGFAALAALMAFSGYHLRLGGTEVLGVVALVLTSRRGGRGFNVWINRPQ